MAGRAGRGAEVPPLEPPAAPSLSKALSPAPALVSRRPPPPSRSSGRPAGELRGLRLLGHERRGRSPSTSSSGRCTVRPPIRLHALGEISDLPAELQQRLLTGVLAPASRSPTRCPPSRALVAGARQGMLRASRSASADWRRAPQPSPRRWPRCVAQHVFMMPLPRLPKALPATRAVVPFPHAPSVRSLRRWVRSASSPASLKLEHSLSPADQAPRASAHRIDMF